MVSASKVMGLVAGLFLGSLALVMLLQYHHPAAWTSTTQSSPSSPSGPARILLAQLAKLQSKGSVKGFKHEDTVTRELALHNALGHVFSSEGRKDDAVHHYSAARDLALRQGDQELITTTRSSLGKTYLDMGKPRLALGEFEAAYESEMAAGRSVPSTLHGLANAKRDLGHIDQAIELYTQTIRDSERARVDATERNAFASLLNDAGAAYRSRGDLDKASSLHRQALAQQEQEQQQEKKQQDGQPSSVANIKLATTYLFMARALHDGGDIKEALNLYDKASQNLKKTSKPSREALQLLGTILGQKARAQSDAGQGIDVALTTSEEAEKTLSLAHEHKEEKYADVIAERADFLRQAGKLKEAWAVAERAFQLQERMAAEGNTNPDMAAVLNTMGNILEDQKDASGAAKYYARALAVNLRTVGKVHPETAVTYNNLASVQQELGNLEAAEQNYLQCLGIQKRTVGDTNPDVAMTYNNLGTVKFELGKLADAEHLFAEAVKIAHAAGLPSDAPNHKTFEEHLAEARSQLGHGGLGQAVML